MLGLIMMSLPLRTAVALSAMGLTQSEDDRPAGLAKDDAPARHIEDLT